MTFPKADALRPLCDTVPMARLGLLLATLAALPVWLAIGQSVLACTGQDATLASGTRQATSVYFARIISDSESSVGFHTLTLDVGSVVKGAAPRRVSQVIGAKVCSGLPDGAPGLVVLGSVNPLGGEPKATYNLFYVVAPRRLLCSWTHPRPTRWQSCDHRMSLMSLKRASCRPWASPSYQCGRCFGGGIADRFALRRPSRSSDIPAR